MIFAVLFLKKKSLSLADLKKIVACLHLKLIGFTGKEPENKSLKFLSLVKLKGDNATQNPQKIIYVIL